MVLRIRYTFLYYSFTLVVCVCVCMRASTRACVCVCYFSPNQFPAPQLYIQFTKSLKNIKQQVNSQHNTRNEINMGRTNLFCSPIHFGSAGPLSGRTINICRN